MWNQKEESFERSTIPSIHLEISYYVNFWEKYYLLLPTAFMRVLQSPDMLFMDIPWKTGGWGFYLPMIIMVLEPCVWLETISHTTDHLFGFSFSWSPPLIAIHINRVGFLHLPTFTTYLCTCRYTAKISTVDMHQSDLCI